jgi:diadenylate cyclase
VLTNIVDDIELLWAGLRLQDLADFILLWMIVYYVLLLIRRTGSMQILSGMGIVAVFYVLSVWWELVALNWVLEKFFSNLFLITVILFQGEIRRAFAHMGSNPLLTGLGSHKETHALEVIARSAVSLAQYGVGALIVIERDINLDYFIEVGTEVDSTLSTELFISIFQQTSPLHDGAVIVRSGRLMAAGCFLPLTKNIELNKNLGTRHRAALGLTEETDAIVIVVSEESRSVSLAVGGALSHNLSHIELRQALYREYGFEKQFERSVTT